MTESMSGSYRPDQLPGHTLVDVNGKSIGTIMGVGATYVDLATGPLHVGTHLYVPFDEIAYCTDTRCFLRVPIDQTHRQEWHLLPEERPSIERAADQGESTETRIPFRPEEPKQRQAGR